MSCEPGTLATLNYAYLMSASAYIYSPFSPEWIFFSRNFETLFNLLLIPKQSSSAPGSFSSV